LILVANCYNGAGSVTADARQVRRNQHNF